MKSKHTQDAEKLVRLICGLLLRYPEKLDIISTEVGSVSILTVIPDPSDYGRVLGKKAGTLQSFKILCECLGRLHGKKIEFVLNQSPEMNNTHNRFTAPEKWSNEPLRRMFKAVCQILDGGDLDVEAADAPEITILKTSFCTVPAESQEKLSAALQIVMSAVGKAIGRGQIIIDLTFDSSRRTVQPNEAWRETSSGLKKWET